MPTFSNISVLQKKTQATSLLPHICTEWLTALLQTRMLKTFFTPTVGKVQVFLENINKQHQNYTFSI
jgi:hypothetical protein